VAHALLRGRRLAGSSLGAPTSHAHSPSDILQPEKTTPRFHRTLAHLLHVPLQASAGVPTWHAKVRAPRMPFELKLALYGRVFACLLASNDREPCQPDFLTSRRDFGTMQEFMIVPPDADPVHAPRSGSVRKQDRSNLRSATLSPTPSSAQRCETSRYSSRRPKACNPARRVAYLSFNNHQLLEGYYGSRAKRAEVVMPLNVRLTPPELIGILNHARSTYPFLRR